MNRSTSAQVDRSTQLLDLVGEIGEWWSGSGPLYRQLATAVAGAIERGAVAHGARLPAERSMASALSVSRGTAVAAYDQLVGDGLVERRPGSGTFAVGPAALALPAGREGSSLVARLVDRSAGPTDLIDLSISVHHDAAGLPEAAVGTRDLLGVAPDTGYSPWGLPGLRSAVAELLGTGAFPRFPPRSWSRPARSRGSASRRRAGSVLATEVVVDDPTLPGCRPRRSRRPAPNWSPCRSTAAACGSSRSPPPSRTAPLSSTCSRPCTVRPGRRWRPVGGPRSPDWRRKPACPWSRTLPSPRR